MVRIYSEVPTQEWPTRQGSTGIERSPSPGILCGRTLSRLNQVRQILRARRRRENFFKGTLFGEPAWDLLLELYAADLSQTRLTVSSACIASAVPMTTALRWMTSLLDEGLITRHADPIDARRVFVSLSEEGREAIETYFEGFSALPVAA